MRDDPRAGAAPSIAPGDVTADFAGRTGDSAGRNAPRVSARRLDIGYAGRPVVTGLDFRLEAGRSLALVGMNGSGKSTLLKTLVGLLPPAGGELTVLGASPGNAPKRIGYLSQFHSSAFVLPLRVIDVVRTGRFPMRGLLGRLTGEDHELVRAAMAAMGVERLAESPLRALSGGQQQRVYIAQVLARRADLLVLDEPTAGLDAGGSERYAAAMRSELARGAALVAATHDIQEARDCDQIMLLARRVVAIGTPREVLTREHLLEAFGIVLTLKDEELGIAVLDREHGHGDGHEAGEGHGHESGHHG